MKDKLNWDIEKQDVFYCPNTLTTYFYREQDKDVFRYVRNDNKEKLSIMSKSYTPFTNSEFMRMTNDIATLTNYELKGYQEWKNGRVVLAYLQNPNINQLRGHDIKEYIVLGNSHDGSTSLFVGYAAQMIRCMNAFGTISQNIKMYHTKSIHDKALFQTEDFSTYVWQRDRFLKELDAFGGQKMSHQQAFTMCQNITKWEFNKENSTRKRNLVDNMFNSITKECNELGWTKFGVYQGITHYTTHVMDKSAKQLNIVGPGFKKNLDAFKYLKNYEL